MSARRNVLSAFVVATFGASRAGVAEQPAPGGEDALLLALDTQRAAATSREEAAYRLADARTGEAQRAAEKEAALAFEEWAGILEQMAATPAQGLSEIAVKAVQVCRALEAGRSEPDQDLAESLEADIARLLPAAASLTA